MKKNAVLMVLLCALLVGCNKYQDNNDSNLDNNELILEDLSYLKRTLILEDNGHFMKKTVTQYQGYKMIEKKIWHDDELYSLYNYEYDGLHLHIKGYYYSTNCETSSECEYLDGSYERVKHHIDEYHYLDTPYKDHIIEYYWEYDGKKQIGYKNYYNGVLVSESYDYNYDGLSCSYTRKDYSHTGTLEQITKFEVEYLDDTYLRQKTNRLTIEYVDGSLTSIRYRIVQFDGKKPIGYKVFENGTITEEGRDYVYDGLKCNYKVDHYRDGVLSYTYSFEEHFLE